MTTSETQSEAVGQDTATGGETRGRADSDRLDRCLRLLASSPGPAGEEELARLGLLAVPESPEAAPTDLDRLM